MFRVLPSAALLITLAGTARAQVPALLRPSDSPTAATSFLVAAAERPSLEPSPVVAAPAACGGKKETVLLTTEDKQKIRGVFYLPEDEDERSPAALLVHSAGADSRELEEVAEYLNKRGFGVLTLDLRGHGESVDGDLDWSKMEDEARERTWAFALRDVAAGAEWLRGRKDIHTSNLTIVGYGTGCTLAVRHAVNDENARAVVLISPRSEQLGFNVLRDLRELGGLPTLILVEKECHDEARRMTEASHKSNGGEEYIEVCYLKCKADKLLSDKRLRSNVGSWLRDRVQPRRGK